MSIRPKKSYRFEEMSSATTVAREMLCCLCGDRGWHDTRESWLAKGARAAGLTIRRARGIFYNEPIKLSADEYLAIQAAYDRASEALASLSQMARDAALQAGDEVGARSPIGESPRGRENPQAHGRSRSPVRSAR